LDAVQSKHKAEAQHRAISEEKISVCQV